ncbi:MAG: sigma-54-dependent transcriptional regulator [Myxococcota bacterium]|nr:sigma-54-dependent Fis family transcriptional regulator [Myxococcota bacterium]MBP8971524.1 sigma-54-dependent Fis family transcriptional regulator [Myxococcota bacterium]HHW96186.1 sigma-54-dependent Fis family transcriptional regulator [Oligoflexales bacterium]HQC44805.1 sigma-54 dependent transcriptional regulator [Myxococcota bacterium]HQL56846.1 sigma-54 dependent transcriptional regulator [Myxococcota bacterium]
MTKRQILVVDDYPNLIEMLTEQLVSDGYNVTTAMTGKEALKTVEAGFLGVILLDVQLPDATGLEIFHQIRASQPLAPVIFITANATLNMAVEATKVGAFDFIEKGPDLGSRLSVAVKNAFNKLAMEEELLNLKSSRSGPNPFPEFITVTPKMQQILETLRSVFNSLASVLIEGESGTGKEVVARGIHAGGNRNLGPFVAVNCAGIPEALLESEMFGYEKGAFTGAVSRRAGKFEAAHKGTLFLDEVGELPKTLQAKLLRVLQDHTFQRVGGTESISVDIRIISATNRDLWHEVQNGNFREDLYYRLAVFPVKLMPLRERPADIPVLAQYFLHRYSEEEGKDIKRFDPVAVQLLKSQPFPGNVRELENLVRHVVIIARGEEISPAELIGALGAHRAQGIPSVESLLMAGSSLQQRLASAFPDKASVAPIKALQLAYFRRALELFDNNISQAASALDVGRATVYRWISDESGE